MGWRQKITSFRSPAIIDYMIGDTIWIGTDADAGLYLYQMNNEWVIASTIGPVYKLDGYDTAIQYAPVNKHVHWTRDSLYLWMNSSNLWIISATAGFGDSEEWVWNDAADQSKGGYYSGDAFWSGSLPDEGESVEFIARGSLRGTSQDKYSGTSIVVSNEFAYLTHADGSGTAPAGIYESIEESVDDRIVGIPQFVDQNKTKYSRSLVKFNDHYTYGSIYYDAENSKWIIGTVGDASGWWEGDEPDAATTTTFTFTKNDDSDAKGEDLTISFDQYILGDFSKKICCAEAPIWL